MRLKRGLKLVQRSAPLYQEYEPSFNLPLQSRHDLLKKLFDLMVANADDLGRLIVSLSFSPVAAEPYRYVIDA